jgi:hypothetical protein
MEIEQIKKLIKYNHKNGEFYRKKSMGNSKKGLIRNTTHNGYLRILILGKRYRCHRLAWLLYYGKHPVKFIDHINGDRSDNRIINLREVTNSENCQNQIRPQKTNKSGYLGVVKHYKNWQANITLMGVRHYLGTFKTAKEAYCAYLNKKKEIHIKSILV